jgi:hypothetical protein
MDAWRLLLFFIFFPLVVSTFSTTMQCEDSKIQEVTDVTDAAASEMLALPPIPDEDIPKLEVNGSSVKLDKLGPIIINSDGTTQRISNWDKLSEIEQKKAWRIIAKRNKKRLEALNAQQANE